MSNQTETKETLTLGQHVRRLAFKSTDNISNNSYSDMQNDHGENQLGETTAIVIYIYSPTKLSSSALWSDASLSDPQLNSRGNKEFVV